VTSGYIVPTIPIYVENDDSKQTPPYDSVVTESSIMSDGDNEFPLVIESNSDDHIDQKRFIPASELLKRIAEANAYEVVQGDAPIKETKKDVDADVHSDSKKNMYIRNTRLFTKSPLDKDIFYTRNTRAPEPQWFLRNTRDLKESDKKRAFYLRNTKRSASVESPVKRAFYLRNTRVGSGHLIDKKGYYLRNTRGLSDGAMKKRAYYLRNTRNSPSISHEKRPFYLRNTRDWFMRNTRNAPVIDTNDGNIFDADNIGINKKEWYMRNTRSSNAQEDPERMARLYEEVLRVLNSVVHAQPNIPSSYMSEDNDDDTITVGKRSAGCMLRCIDEGHLHPAQCHSLC